MLEPWFRRALERKRDGEPLDAPTWDRIVARYVEGTLDEAAVAALLMAATIRGLDDDETYALTAAMVRSGDELHHTGLVIDKHSSGGVADTVSLIVVPLAAACGVRVAKLSGPALGHTGGTLDKLRAIPGVRTDIDPDAFRAQVERVGCAIVAQSARLVPADKKIYALRDRTATTPGLGLIASSIVSKKIAGGAGAIVFDVKSGPGSLLRMGTDPVELAERMVVLAKRFGRQAAALVTNMDEPLGTAIGTGLEAIEARDFLSDRHRDGRLAGVVDLVVTEMLRLGGLSETDIVERPRDALASGTAYECFCAMIEAQGGTRTALEAMIPAAERCIVRASTAGTVAAIDAVALGNAAREIVERYGGLAGILVRRRIGDAVAPGAPLLEIVGTDRDEWTLAQAFDLQDRVVEPGPLLVARIRDTFGTAASKRVVV